MKEEKKDVKKEIIVLDKGVKLDDIIGPRGVCCTGAYIPIRG